MKRVTVALSITIALAAIFLGISPLKNLNLAYAQTVDDPDAIRVISWSPNSSIIAAGYNDGTLRLWNADTGQLIAANNLHSDTVLTISWNETSNRLVSGGITEIYIWDTSNFQSYIAELTEPSRGFFWSDWHSDLGRILIADFSGPNVYIYNDQSYTLINRVLGATVIDATLSPDGTQLIAANPGGTIDIFDPLTLTRIARLIDPEQDLGGIITQFYVSVAHHPTNSQAASSLRDTSIQVWDLDTEEVIYAIPPISPSEDRRVSGVIDLRYSADGSQLFTVLEDGLLVTIDANTGDLLHKQQLLSPIYAAEWSPDGSRLAYGGGGAITRVQFLDMPNGR